LISGTVITAGPGTFTQTGRRKIQPYDEGYVLAFGGLDQRVYIARDWYAGGDLGASGWDTFYYLTGDAYMGYDFNTKWGVRGGYAFDYFSHENSNKSVKVEPLLGAAYVQVVWGF